MKIYFVIMKKIALFALNWVFEFIDANKNGKIEKREIKAFVKEIQKILKGGLKR
jgi:Ca2+-binding EF-hand superfamily protein